MTEEERALFDAASARIAALEQLVFELLRGIERSDAHIADSVRNLVELQNNPAGIDDAQLNLAAAAQAYLERFGERLAAAKADPEGKAGTTVIINA